MLGLLGSHERLQRIPQGLGLFQVVVKKEPGETIRGGGLHAKLDQLGLTLSKAGGGIDVHDTMVVLDPIGLAHGALSKMGRAFHAVGLSLFM